MFSKIALTSLALFVFVATPVFAADECKKGNFVGSYTLPRLNVTISVGGDTFIHSFVSQLTLHSDGTATLFFTGVPDFTMTGGTGSINIGSWGCRADDKVVVNLIHAFYQPAIVDGERDIVLSRHFRDTYLFTITDDNTLTRTEFRRRAYTAAEDPTDPTAGTLQPLNTTQFVFKRLIVSDADLLAP